MKKRVVITGLGTVNPLGKTTEETWAKIKNNECGLSFISGFDTTDYQVKVAGEVADFDPTPVIDKRAAKRMDRFCQFAVVSAHEAVKMSGVDLDTIDKDRFGVIIGSGIGGIGSIEEQEQRLLEKGPRRVSALTIPMIITNMAAGYVSIEFGAKGLVSNVVTACASGTNSIGEAFYAIQQDRADLVLAGGAEASITPLAISGFQSMTALSTSDDPKRASIPFDAERGGFVMGEGAGVVMVESLEHAQKRGANILAEVVGYGFRGDAYHITSPAPGGVGAYAAMKEALDVAGVDPSEIDYINAHGTSTELNDSAETQAIKTLLGDRAYEVPVSSSKSMFGHLLGAAGAVEAIVCIKAMEEGFVPATLGYREKDPACDLDYVPNAGRAGEIAYALSNSLGFGGHNASLLLKRWEEN